MSEGASTEHSVCCCLQPLLFAAGLGFLLKQGCLRRVEAFQSLEGLTVDGQKQSGGLTHSLSSWTLVTF